MVKLRMRGRIGDESGMISSPFLRAHCIYTRQEASHVVADSPTSVHKRIIKQTAP